MHVRSAGESRRQAAREETGGPPEPGKTVTELTSSLLITTKLVEPRLGAGIVDRPRLLDLVSSAPSARLIVIVAPGGFGKTSFAAAWLARLRAAGHRTGWLTIDPEDDEPGRFLHCVSRALLRASGDIDLSAAGLSAEASLAAPQAIVSALINQLAEIDDELYLVLDDFHWLTDPAIHDAVALLVSRAPPNFHLVLTTREQPSLPLARLRANGELLEIEAAALRFDIEETRQFLQQTCDNRLGWVAISRLHVSTEGWAAALRLAAAGVVQGKASPEAQALATARPFAAYLEEMLASLPEDTVAFMTRVAVLDNLTADLCQAVTGVAESGELLERVARRRLLLEPVDDEGRWYRFHRLLLDYLRQRLHTQLAGEEPMLHRRAFAWYAEREMWTDAARHAIAAGDVERALDWISRCAMTLVKRGDLLTLIGWQRLLPAEFMRGQIRVRLAIVWGLVLAMRAAESRPMLEQIEQDARAQTAGQEQADLLWECQAVRALMLALLDDDTQASLALSESCIARPSADPWNTNVLSNLLRYTRWKAGDVDGVYAAPWIPYSLEQDRRNVFSSAYRHALLAGFELDLARFDLAERDGREAMRLAEKYVGLQSGAAAIGAPMLADCFYEQGRLDEAEGLLIDRIPTIDAVVIIEGVRRSYIVLARIATLRSDFERAYALLAQAEALGYNRKWDRLVSGVLGERLRLLLLEDRLGEASACVVRLEQLAALNPVAAPCARAEIHRDLALARVELACAHNHWAEASDLIENLHREAQALGNVRLMMQLKARLAVVLMAANDVEGALRALRAALEIAAPARACRSVVDAGGADIGPLLARFRSSSTCPKGLEPCVDQLLAGCGGDDLEEVPGRPGGASPTLSHREHDVLVLIAEGRSNKEVARALGITPETVKTHLKKVFEKLSVERRAQAVARAQPRPAVSGCSTALA